jgi:hypothetical protein
LLDVIAETLGLKADMYGKRVFRCSSKGCVNIRWTENELVQKCQVCGSKDVLPPGMRSGQQEQIAPEPVMVLLS